jgi:hypothetical protein
MPSEISDAALRRDVRTPTDQLSVTRSISADGAKLTRRLKALTKTIASHSRLRRESAKFSGGSARYRWHHTQAVPEVCAGIPPQMLYIPEIKTRSAAGFPDNGVLFLQHQHAEIERLVGLPCCHRRDRKVVHFAAKQQLQRIIPGGNIVDSN